MCRAFNYFEHFLVLISAVRGCVSISEFASLVGVTVVIASSAVVLNTCELAKGFKNWKSVVKKKRKKHDKIMLLAKTKLNINEVSSSKASINSYINHEEIASVNNAL